MNPDPKPEPVHAFAGLGFTYCGKKAGKNTSGDEREVTCPSCKTALANEGRRS